MQPKIKQQSLPSRGSESKGKKHRNDYATKQTVKSYNTSKTTYIGKTGTKGLIPPKGRGGLGKSYDVNRTFQSQDIKNGRCYRAKVTGRKRLRPRVTDNHLKGFKSGC